MLFILKNIYTSISDKIFLALLYIYIILLLYLNNIIHFIYNLLL